MYGLTVLEARAEIKVSAGWFLMTLQGKDLFQASLLAQTQPSLWSLHCLPSVCNHPQTSLSGETPQSVIGLGF